MADMTTAITPSRWKLARLTELTALELQRIHAARQEVFVVEQNCPFQDADAADELSWHLAAFDAEDRVLAYARLVPPGVKYAEASMGRVITTALARGQGLGRVLIAKVLEACNTHYPGHAMRISAQSRLERLYGDFGFVAQGKPYMEDWMPHTEMLRQAGPLKADQT